MGSLLILALVSSNATARHGPVRSSMPVRSTPGTGSLLVTIQDHDEPTRHAATCVLVDVTPPWLEAKPSPWGYMGYMTTRPDTLCTDSDRGALFEGLLPGVVRVRTRGGGYIPAAEPVRIVAGRRAKVVLRLRRPTPDSVVMRLHVLVRDSLNDEPISGAGIRVLPGRHGAMTNEEGWARVDFVARSIRLDVQQIGYRAWTDSLDVKRGGTDTLVVRLQNTMRMIESPVIIPSSELTIRLVTANRSPLHGFTLRMKDDLGKTHVARTNSDGAATFEAGGDALRRVRVWTVDTLGYEALRFGAQLRPGDTQSLEFPLEKIPPRRR